jgi:hypothetical protein
MAEPPPLTRLGDGARDSAMLRYNAVLRAHLEDPPALGEHVPEHGQVLEVRPGDVALTQRLLVELG